MAFGVGVWVVALASVAYACVPFSGTMTISGNYDSYATSQTVEGSWTYHGWCVAPAGWTVRVTKSTAANVHVTVAPVPSTSSCYNNGGATPNKLFPSSLYQLRVMPGEMTNGLLGVSSNPCYNNGSYPNKSTAIATGVTVDGTGNATINTTSNFDARKAGIYAVCLSRPTPDGQPTSALGMNVYSL